jgi:acyl-CoA synthetase (NDP forming)
MAIVGASGRPMKFGSLYTLSQIAYGFSGDLYLVNPKEAEIAGRATYADLKSLPQIPDLVCITIPAAATMQVLKECAELGVKGVVILASGFREAGEAGRQLEEEALRLARSGGFRIIGPNCFGLYNPRNGLTLLPGYDFSKEPGGFAFISQSGGFSVHVGRLCKGMEVGFSAIVSYGNGADVDESDLLRYFARDKATTMIGAYLEGVDDGRRFISALEEAASQKPVIVWKVGKTQSSIRAVQSHTGSLAGSSAIWQGVLKQVGAIEVSGVEECCDVALALQLLGRNPGKRLMLVGGGGGLGTHGGDLAETAGLEVPALEPGRLARAKEVLSQAGAAAGNPMDIGAPLVPLPLFEAAMREAADQPGTDIVLFDMAINFAYGLGGEAGLEAASDILLRVKEESGKPFVMVLYSRADGPDDLEIERILRQQRKKLLLGGIAVYPSIARAIRAIALVNR